MVYRDEDARELNARASYEARSSCPGETFYRRYTSSHRCTSETLNDTTERGLDPLLSFCQSWTADGPDGRRGRSAGATARTRGGDRATSRRPATAADLARAGTPTWRIAPAACATVSHLGELSLRLDCASRSSGSNPRSAEFRRALSSCYLATFRRNVKISITRARLSPDANLITARFVGDHGGTALFQTLFPSTYYFTSSAMFVELITELI